MSLFLLLSWLVCCIFLLLCFADQLRVVAQLEETRGALDVLSNQDHLRQIAAFGASPACCPLPGSWLMLMPGLCGLLLALIAVKGYYF